MDDTPTTPATGFRRRVAADVSSRASNGRQISGRARDYPAVMASTVVDVFSAAALRPAGEVRWGAPIPLDAPGVYTVGLSHDPHSVYGALSEAPIDLDALRRLLAARPELRVDGGQPTVGELAARLRAFWLAEVLLYVGLAGTSVRERVRQYYRTPLGARRPHAGGWWLKTLTVLDHLRVHWAPAPDPTAAETAMLLAFASGVSAPGLAALHDPGRVAPSRTCAATLGW